jgi:hypothetical protein
VRNASPDSTHFPDISDLDVIGAIVLLQVQVRSLKHGERPRSWYDPEPITAVSSLQIDPGGVTGIDGTGEPTIGDVHHRDHPVSKFRGDNGLSFGFTSHYGRMRDRFGDHLQTGIAGENIIIRSERVFEEDHLARGIVVMSRRGPVEFGAATSVKPCAEFSRWCLRYSPDRMPDAAVTDALKFLFSGTRGFLATIERDVQPWPRIDVGDLVYRRRVSLEKVCDLE